MKKLPIKTYKYDPGDDLKHHPNDFMFRSAWGPGQRNDIPAGQMGVMVRKEATKETQYILVPVEVFEKFGWTQVVNPAIYPAWNRK